MKNTIIFEPHDLIYFDPPAIQGEDRPEWVMRALNVAPFAVIKRIQTHNKLLSVGIRGRERDQRWGCFISPDAIRGYLKPENLIDYRKNVLAKRLLSIPALTAFNRLVDRFKEIKYPWGPTGSVGFELATRTVTAKPSSDLDLILRCAEPISKVEATFLFKQTHDLNVRCDILIETPLGAVALQEFINNNGSMVVRTTTGPHLMNDPWFGGYN